MFVVTGVTATIAGVVLPIPETLESSNQFLFGPWTTLGVQEWLVITVLALAMLIGSIGAAVAYQVGPAPLVATFDYAYLVFACFWGILLFTEIPDPVTLVGMAMITAGGVLSIRGSRP